MRKKEKKKKEHTTPGIRWWSPTQLLVWPSLVYLWESGRDPEFSSGYGRMWRVEEVEMYILGWLGCGGGGSWVGIDGDLYKIYVSNG